MMKQTNPLNECDLRQLGRRLGCLAVLRGCLRDEVLAALLAFLRPQGPSPAETETRAERYCAFVAALYEAGGDLGAHLLRLVLDGENPVLRLRARGQAEPPQMAAALGVELALMSDLSALEPGALAGSAAECGPNTQMLVGALVPERPQVCSRVDSRATVPGRPYVDLHVMGTSQEAAPTEPALPLFQNTQVDFAAEYAARLARIGAQGCGIFAQHHMFTLAEGSRLVPVKNPDPQRLSQLTGYEQERAAVVLNTKALLRGLYANNILLYGDAGTGKSSTVKALANEYRGEGLRLVEVRKNQLYQIPALLDALAENPLKFILFIDDLSFPENDADFTALKAILEGNISARPQNIVVYATSNRRHLLRQRHADRAGDDVHLADTLEEQASLAARFGLSITFLKPDKTLYTDIVSALAGEYGLKTPLPQLLAAAEAHAIRAGGRSPRVARQFVQTMQAQEALGP